MANSLTRVLIVEDSIGDRRSFEMLVKSEHYEAIVAEGQGKTLIDDALAKCRDNLCQIAIVDLHLESEGRRDDLSGFHKVAKHIEDSAIIIVSAELELHDISNQLELDEKTFGLSVDFLEKHHAPRQLPDFLKKWAHLRSSTKRQIYPSYELGMKTQMDQFLERMGFGDSLNLGHEVIGDLLVRLYPDAKGFNLMPIDRGPNTTSTTLARNSLVCRVELHESSRMDPVVKFARPSAIKAEYQNYRDFVHHHIPWQSYAGLDESAALFYRIGAIGLDMVMAKPFSSMYRLGDTPQKLGPVLESIKYFASNWTHYTSHKLHKDPCDGKDFLKTYITVWDKNKSNEISAIIRWTPMFRQQKAEVKGY